MLIVTGTKQWACIEHEPYLKDFKSWSGIEDEIISNASVTVAPLGIKIWTQLKEASLWYLIVASIRLF